MTHEVDYLHNFELPSLSSPDKITSGTQTSSATPLTITTDKKARYIVVSSLSSVYNGTSLWVCDVENGTMTTIYNGSPTPTTIPGNYIYDVTDSSFKLNVIAYTGGSSTFVNVAIYY